MVKTAFQISSQELPCYSFACFPPTCPCPGTASTHPQGGVWCLRLGLPPVSPSCCSPSWGNGTGPVATASHADWRWKRHPPPSSLPSKQFCIICTGIQQKTSHLQALLQRLPLAVSFCSSVRAREQIHVSSEISIDLSSVGFYWLLLVPMQIQYILYRIFSEHGRRLCLKEKTSTNMISSQTWDIVIFDFDRNSWNKTVSQGPTTLEH